METFSTLLALCEGNPPVTGGFASQRPVIWNFDVFFDLCLNKWLSKQSRHRWFEMPLHSLWHRCNETLHTGGWFSTKMFSYLYRKSHCGDKMILQPSYPHRGISYIGKMTTLYWIRPEAVYCAMKLPTPKLSVSFNSERMEVSTYLAFFNDFKVMPCHSDTARTGNI